MKIGFFAPKLCFSRIVTGYYGFTLAVRVSPSVHPSVIYLSNRIFVYRQ